MGNSPSLLVPARHHDVERVSTGGLHSESEV